MLENHDSFITLLALVYSAEMSLSLSLKEYFCTKLLERLDRIDQYLYQIQMMKQPLTWKMLWVSCHSPRLSVVLPVVLVSLYSIVICQSGTSLDFISGLLT